MKVLLKSLEELKEEYGSNIIDNDLIELYGKVVEAKYGDDSDSYIINDYWLHSNLIKGEVIGYTIKKLSDGKKCTFSL